MRQQAMGREGIRRDCVGDLPCHPEWTMEGLGTKQLPLPAGRAQHCPLTPVVEWSRAQNRRRLAPGSIRLFRPLYLMPIDGLGSRMPPHDPPCARQAVDQLKREFSQQMTQMQEEIEARQEQRARALRDLKAELLDELTSPRAEAYTLDDAASADPRRVLEEPDPWEIVSYTHTKYNDDVDQMVRTMKATLIDTETVARQDIVEAEEGHWPTSAAVVVRAAEETRRDIRAAESQQWLCVMEQFSLQYQEVCP